MSDQVIKRDRSPNYPKLSLEKAIDYLRLLHKAAGKATIMPPVAVQAIGYSGISGAALTTLAALNQYGLLDRERGEGLKVSSLGVKLIHPLSPEQEAASRAEASMKPPVFRELITDGFLNADASLLANHLIQNGFTPEGARRASGVFSENKEFSNLNDENTILESIPEVAMDNMPRIHQTIGQFVHPKPAGQQPDIFRSPGPRTQQREGEATNPPQTNALILPLESGRTISIPRMSEGDYELMLDTIKLWKRRIVISNQGENPPENPA